MIVFYQSPAPPRSMTYLQSALAEGHNLFNTVDLLNLGKDRQGLSVIIGMFQHLKPKRFSHSTES